MNLNPVMPDTPVLNAEALYADLLRGVGAILPVGGVLVGIWSGGAWLAQRLHKDLGLLGAPGLISSTLHRDDYSSRGLSRARGATQLPFAIDGQHIVLIDDVLYTGRTIRAVVNELFDFGRPASVSLAVMVERAGRQLPVAAAFAAVRLELPEAQRLSLERDDAGVLSLVVSPPAIAS